MLLTTSKEVLQCVNIKEALLIVTRIRNAKGKSYLLNGDEMPLGPYHFLYYVGVFTKWSIR